MSEKLLSIKDLRIEYRTDIEVVEAVNGITLEVDRGETLGLVGETGAGKTTTALSIMGLLPERTAHITSGSIEFEGKDLLTMSEEDLRYQIRGEKIAMIFQDPMTSLNPVLTVGEQIAEALELHNSEGRSKAEIQKRVEEVLRMVGIAPERKHEYPHQFSGGMKQRVVIAIALACEPELLIADEPTTALDVTIQAQVLMMMRELREKINMPLIMITHDLGVVAQICDHVAVMYAGEIIEAGPIRSIYFGEKHHPYTEGLFGSVPNINDTCDRLKPIAGMMPDPTQLPEGCCFADRCPKCMDICRKEHPSYYTEGEHRICCHLFKEEAANE